MKALTKTTARLIYLTLIVTASCPKAGVPGISIPGFEYPVIPLPAVAEPVQVKANQTEYVPVSSRLKKIQGILFPEVSLKPDETRTYFLLYDVVRGDEVELGHFNPVLKRSQELILKVDLIRKNEERYYLVVHYEGSGGKGCNCPSRMVDQVMAGLNERLSLEARTQEIIKTVLAYASGADLMSVDMAPSVRVRALQASMESPYWSDRATSVYFMSKVPGPDADTLLLDSYKDEDPKVRWAVLWVLVGRSDKAVADLMVKAMQDPDPWVRRTAAWSLKAYASAEAIKALVDALHDDDDIVRVKSIESLGVIGGDDSVEPILKMLGDKRADVRVKSVEALGKIGSVKAIPALLQLMASTEASDKMLAMAAWSLIEIGDETVVPEIMSHYVKMPRDFSRRQAAKVLLSFWNDKIASFFVDRLEGSYPDEHVAMWVFSRKKYAKAIKPAMAATARIDDQEEYDQVMEKQWESEASGAGGGEDAGNAYSPYYFDSYDYSTSSIVLLEKVLMLNVTSENSSVLLHGLKSSSSGVRITCIKMMGEMGDGSSFKPLKKMLKDDDPDVVKAAMKALLKLKGADRGKILALGLHNADPEVKITTILELGKYPDPAVADEVAAVLSDKDPAVGFAAADYLAQIHDPRAVPFLKKRLSDSDDLCHAAIMLCRVLGNSVDTEILKKALQCPESYDLQEQISNLRDSIKGSIDPDVKDMIKQLVSTNKTALIMAAMGELECSESVPVLIDCVKSCGDIEAKKVAAFYLGALKAKEAVPVLLGAGDEAMNALGEIGDCSVLADVAQAAAVPSDDLGFLPAAMALQKLVLYAGCTPNAESLGPMLGSDNANARALGIELLSTVSQTSAKTRILTARYDSNPIVRKAVVSALAGMESDIGTIACLIELLEDPDRGVKLAAIMTLAAKAKGFDGALEALESMISWPDEEVRGAVLNAIAALR